MGYALSVYRVPQQMLDRAYGKHDEAMLSKALVALKSYLADCDKQMDAPNLEDYDVDISHADALRQIFAGEFTEGVNGSRYGWAFEALCSLVGEGLSNVGFSPCKVAWYEQLDEVLADQRVPLRFADLIHRSPLPIPPADDWPCVGHWGLKDLAAVGPLAELLPHIDDPEVKESLATALGWLRGATENPGSVIVGFHG